MDAVSANPPHGGLGRRYAAPDAARMLGLTPSAVIRWIERGKIAGLPPRTTHNPTRSWVVDADEIDRRLEMKPSTAGRGTPTVDTRPSDDEQFLEIERSVFQTARMAALQEENDRLRGENDRLRAQLAVLGRAVAEITAVDGPYGADRAVRTA